MRRQLLLGDEMTVRILGMSGVQSAHTGNTNETTLATISIPAGVMGTSGALRVTFLGSMTDSGNNHTFKATLGSTDFIAITVTSKPTVQRSVIIWNRGDAASQVSFPAGAWDTYNVHDDAVTTGTENTGGALNLLLTGQLADGGEDISIEGYLVELLTP